MHNVFHFIFSHGKINWKAFNTVFEDFSLSWSLCPAKMLVEKKKIRLWSTLFSSSTSKMIHVIEKKILPPFEERSMEKENFWLNDDLHGLPLLLLNNASSTKIWSSSFQREFLRPKFRQGFQYKNSHLSTLESSIPASDTSTTSSTTSILQARRRMVPELLRCQKGFWTWPTTR